MAGVKKNAEDYINKLYDATQEKEKQLLTDAYNNSTGALDTEKQNVQQQTDTNVERTNVEAQRTDLQYKPANVSAAVSQQAALTMENQQKKNVQQMQDQQQNADAEFERLRKLYADQFAAQIKQAQADNDLARAQQLYEAAKAKEAQLWAFSSGMGTLDDQALIDQIYSSATESAVQEQNIQRAEKLSELAAQQEAQRRQTDENLKQTYVDALRQNMNMAEYQTARGLGSGNVAQSRLARDMNTTDTMTQLRRAQLAADAQTGGQIAEAERTYADAVAEVAMENERKRAEAMYKEALTQKPKSVAVQEESSGGGGAYVPPNSGNNSGYEEVLRDIQEAKLNGNYGGSIQSMINAAYKEGMITAAEKKELEKERNGLGYAG